MSKPAVIERTEDFIADMENLSRHAEFIQIGSVIDTLKLILRDARELNAELRRAETPHIVAG